MWNVFSKEEKGLVVPILRGVGETGQSLLGVAKTHPLNSARALTKKRRPGGSVGPQAYKKGVVWRGEGKLKRGKSICS